MSRIVKAILIIVLTTVLTTLTINAGDNFHDISNSLLGAVLPIEKNTCPENMVFVDTEEGGFCIDKYEVSPSKDCIYTNPSNQDETRINLQQKECVPVSKPSSSPWRFIAQHQASLACIKAGKRLPSNEEWYRAAMGTPDGVGSKECALGLSRTAPYKTGEFLNCISFVGAYDMVGNVWEWVDETVVDGIYNRQTLPKEGYVSSVGVDGVPIETNTVGPDPNFNEDYFWLNKEGVRGMFRGGYWGLADRVGIYGVYSVMDPSFVGAGLGFRCVK